MLINFGAMVELQEVTKSFTIDVQVFTNCVGIG